MLSFHKVMQIPPESPCICRRLWIEAAEWISSLGEEFFFWNVIECFWIHAEISEKLISVLQVWKSLLNSLLLVPCSKYHDPSNAFEFPPYLGRAAHYYRWRKIHKCIHFRTDISIYTVAARPFWYDCTCLTTLCDQLFLWSRVQCGRSLRSSKHVPYSDWCSSRCYEWKAHSQVNSAVGPLCSRNGTCNKCFQAVYTNVDSFCQLIKIPFFTYPLTRFSRISQAYVAEKLSPELYMLFGTTFQFAI